MSLLQIQLLLAHEPAVYTKGWIVTLVGFAIVIVALFVLSYIFRGVAAYFTQKDAKKIAPEQKNATAVKVETKPVEKVKEGEIPGEVLTAIGMALYLSTNLHDEESNVITIERRQTAWNDKYYGVRHGIVKK
ncbi:MAG: OadG family protein [Bacteroidales bacterium]|nr:OadG family protein [Bacteroidales bacterium]